MLRPELTQDFQLFMIDEDFDVHYGLLTLPQTVVVHPYSDDSDDQVLQEIKPRFIVMYEPNLKFIRCIEVCLVHNVTFSAYPLFCRYTGTRTRVWVSGCIL